MCDVRGDDGSEKSMRPARQILQQDDLLIRCARERELWDFNKVNSHYDKMEIVGQDKRYSAFYSGGVNSHSDPTRLGFFQGLHDVTLVWVSEWQTFSTQIIGASCLFHGPSPLFQRLLFNRYSKVSTNRPVWIHTKRFLESRISPGSPYVGISMVVVSKYRLDI